MLCQDCWQILPYICLCAKPCYVKTAGRGFLTPVYVLNQAMPGLLAEASSHLFMCQTMLCQDCWQRLLYICLCTKPCYARSAGRDFLTSVNVPNYALPGLLAETSSHLFMCQIMLCLDCWQTLPYIRLCAKPCYAKTAGRESSHLFMCQTMLCQDCWQTLPHICLCAIPCYAKTAGRDFLTSVNMPNHAMPRPLADTSSYLLM